MKTRNLIPLSCVLASLIFISGCGGKKYSDAEKVMDESSKAMEEMAAKIEKAANAGDVAKALNGYSDKMEKLMPEIKKLNEKYPELKNTTNLPEELKESQDKATAATQKYSSAMMKMMSYMMDPEVQKAQQHMTEVMTKYQN